MEEFKKFDCVDAFEEIKADWLRWAAKNGAQKWVVGISGGVDSSTVAALAVRIFGRDSVIGVQLPCGVQSDIADSDLLFAHLKIRKVTLNIGRLFDGLKAALSEADVKLTEQSMTNMPPRLRMTALYAVAQGEGAMVLNTCNISETLLGYDTLWGDSCGSYAPIKALTKTEVFLLAEWLGLPKQLARKTPRDGLQPLDDEEKIGMRYVDVDECIRGESGSDPAVLSEVIKRHKANAFKMKMIQIDGPEFPFLKNVIISNELQECPES